MKTYFSKTGQWITLLYWKPPSCNEFPQCKILIVFQNNGILVEKQKHVLQISLQELHNDMILPIYEGVF